MVGCIAQKGTRHPVEGSLPDAYALYDKVTQRCQRIVSLKGWARVRVASPGKTFSVDQVVAVARPSSVRLETIDFWGHTAFLVLLHKGEYRTYSASDNRYLTGQAAVDELRNYIGLAWEPESIVRLLLSDPVYTGLDQEVSVSIAIDEGYWRLDVEHTAYASRYLLWIDRRDLPVRSLLVSSPDVDTWPPGIEVGYSNYREINGIEFPCSLVLSIPPASVQVKVDYDTLVLNSVLPDATFERNIP